MNTEPAEPPRSSAPIRTLASGGMFGFGAIALISWPLLAAFRSPATVVGVPTTWDSLIIPAILAIIAVIGLNALFVAGETAMDLLRPVHVKAVSDDPKKEARLQRILDRKAAFVATCFLCSQTLRALLVFLVFIPAPRFAESVLSRQFGLEYGWGTIIFGAFLLSIPVGIVNVLVAELIPKSYGVTHPVSTSVRLSNLVRAFAVLFAIPSDVATRIASIVTKRFGADATFAVINRAEEEIKNILETGEETGEIEEDEREMVRSVFEFTDSVAREVMTPRVDIEGLQADQPMEALLQLILESGHSRIPVYEETDDQIIGVVHAKDVLQAIARAENEIKIRELMRPAVFIPENKNLTELLHLMRATRNQMVIVQDEYGGTAGIVTMEDLVEEVMGDIVDEYDEEEPDLIEVDTGWIVRGRVHLDDVNSDTGLELNSDEFDTIGGYVFGLFGRQPKEGEQVECDRIRFTVHQTDGRRIEKIAIEALTPEEASPDEALS